MDEFVSNCVKSARGHSQLHQENEQHIIQDVCNVLHRTVQTQIYTELWC